MTELGWPGLGVALMRCVYRASASPVSSTPYGDTLYKSRSHLPASYKSRSHLPASRASPPS
jgi:hypothetical protein